MNSRIAHLKARIAKLEEAIADEESREADGASMIKGCGKFAEDKLPEPPKEINADDEELPPVPKFEAKASQRRRAFRRRAGIEDRINQKYLTDVEGITRKPAGVDPSIRTKLRHASVALDRIADQLEKQGRIALAYRVDRVSDEIDRRLEKMR